jgi:uncharacterized damage-inducible protein DinB
MATDPHIEAAQAVLDDSLAEMRQCIDGAAAEGLTWRPGGDDTNSITVLAVHSLHSTRMWLSVATGVALPDRDRDSEFVTKGMTSQELLAFMDDFASQCSKLLEEARVDDWSVVRRTHLRPDDRPRSATAAWALLHAMEHLREHVGQMQVTRQLWLAVQARG